MSERSTDTQSGPDADNRNDAVDTDRRTDAVDNGTMTLLSGLAALIGVWIAASPFVFESTETALWNNAIVGATIVLLAGYNYYRLSNGQAGSVGIASLVALLGLWALAAPFLLEMGSDELVWSTAASGLIVAASSGYNAYATQDADTAAAGTRT